MFNDDIYVHFSPAISFSEHVVDPFVKKPFVSAAIFQKLNIRLLTNNFTKISTISHVVTISFLKLSQRILRI